MLFTHAISESFLKVIFCVITAFKKGHFDETIKRTALRGLVQVQQSECSSSRRACLLPLPSPGQTPAPSMGGRAAGLGSTWGSLGTLAKAGLCGGLRSQSLHSSLGTWASPVFILNFRWPTCTTEMIRLASQGCGEDETCVLDVGAHISPSRTGAPHNQRPSSSSPDVLGAA